MTTPNTLDEIWRECCLRIKDKVGSEHFKTWILPIKAIELNGNYLLIQLPSQFFYEYMPESGVLALLRTLRELLDCDVTLQYMIIEDRHYNDKSFKNEFGVPTFNAMWDETQVDPAYTFETFMAGNGNISVLEAAKEIAEKPGGSLFNPFVVYGETSRGKTHLVQAIGNEVRRTQPHMKILHVNVEKFIHQFVAHNIRNTTYDFLHFYQSIDLLILEDIQYISRAEMAQDALITIFNYLLRYGKHIVLTSNKPTKDIKAMKDRLLTQMNRGLSVNIQIPDYDTRIKIIKQNLYREGLELPNDVIGYFACNFIDNMKDLTLVLRLLLLYSTFAKKEIDLESARRYVKGTKAILNLM